MYETNLERWFFYLKDSVSPDSYIRWGFFSLIAAALERRVWNGVEENPLFPNIYVVLVGPPGIGKGRTIGPVKDALKFHKTNDAANLMNQSRPANLDSEKKQNVKSTDPTVIQISADATTYESLVHEMSTCVRGASYKVTSEPSKIRLYVHSSMTTCLEEISSMFRKYTNDLVNFFLVAYDCKDYDYKTISRGSDYIQKCCLNLLAGTTPSFIKTIFSDELLTDGFASRVFFIVEHASRFRSIKPSTLSAEQKEEYEKILAHIKSLSKLFGPIKFTKEAEDYLDRWWDNEPNERVNKNTKLAAYYARKDIHIKKLAMVLHFCDNLTTTVELKYVKMAIEETSTIEVKMHGAVTLDNKNPLAAITESIYQHLKANGPQRKEALLMEFWGELPQQEDSLETVINFLQKSKRIKQDKGKYEAI